MMGVLLALLLAVPAGADEGVKGEAVEVGCVIAVGEGGKAVVVGEPKVRTVAGRAAKVESSTGAGDGRPGLRLEVELMPRVEAGVARVEAAASLTADDGRRVVAAAVGAPMTVVLRLDAATIYTVTCGAQVVAEQVAE